MDRESSANDEKSPDDGAPPDDETLRRIYRLPDDDEALLAECRVTAFKAPGPGGQHKNTTLSAIRLVHGPSGLVVIGRRERSQTRNLNDALARLRERLVVKLTPPKKRRKTKPSRQSREKRLDAKKKRGAVKRLRGSRSFDE